MKIEDIFNSWEKDSQIDRTELGEESLKIPALHNKYYRILAGERVQLKKLQADFKTLMLEKHEFYSMGHTEETRAKGWKLPPKGVILKSEIPMYIEGDRDIIDVSLKIGIQQEKVDFLESIIKSFQTRGYLIRLAHDDHKFKMGG